MRVIAGTARGIPLIAPEGRDTRPTSDRVRESLFNILGPRIVGAEFLDLFAGTGANGIEALSRGAARCVFIEHSRAACDCILKNAQKARVWDRGALHRTALPEALARVPGTFDIVVADPPYAYEHYADLLQALLDYDSLAPQALVVIEHERRAELPELVGRLHRTRQTQYGDTVLSFYA
jgi:16S rRNA (guanine966-N2)-methyltransferase